MSAIGLAALGTFRLDTYVEKAIRVVRRLWDEYYMCKNAPDRASILKGAQRRIRSDVVMDAT